METVYPDNFVCFQFTPGDRGYPLKSWLMTLLTNPQTDQERRYNDLHSHSRSVVERTIGLLKGRGAT